MQNLGMDSCSGDELGSETTSYQEQSGPGYNKNTVSEYSVGVISQYHSTLPEQLFGAFAIYRPQTLSSGHLNSP